MEYTDNTYVIHCQASKPRSKAVAQDVPLRRVQEAVAEHLVAVRREKQRRAAGPSSRVAWGGGGGGWRRALNSRNDCLDPRPLDPWWQPESLWPEPPPPREG